MYVELVTVKDAKNVRCVRPLASAGVPQTARGVLSLAAEQVHRN